MTTITTPETPNARAVALMDAYRATLPRDPEPLRVLVACEYSGRVRDAFTALGHDATSCDLLPSETPGKHYQGDVQDILGDGWDLMVAHPPCTYLAVSGARWWAGREKEQDDAAAFFIDLYNAPIPKVAIENPVGAMSTRFRPPDQYIQPYQFGHGETKKTGLWLRGLPLLQPTNIVDGRENRVHRESPGPDRWKRRSTTLQGIADAMAAQWGCPAVQRCTTCGRDVPSDLEQVFDVVLCERCQGEDDAEQTGLYWAVVSEGRGRGSADQLVNVLREGW